MEFRIEFKSWRKVCCTEKSWQHEMADLKCTEKIYILGNHTLAFARGQLFLNKSTPRRIDDTVDHLYARWLSQRTELQKLSAIVAAVADSCDPILQKRTDRWD